MNRAAEMRSPAPRANAGNRAEVACNEAPFTIAQHKSEAPSTAICLGGAVASPCRWRKPPPRCP